ncbi:MAG: PEP-CTERM sorting domain-containing protein [Pseudomonadota bacterium]
MLRRLFRSRSLMLGGLFSLLFMASPDPAAASLVLDTNIGGGSSCDSVDCILEVQDTSAPVALNGMLVHDVDSGCVGRSGFSNQIGSGACLFGLEGGDEIVPPTRAVMAGIIDDLTDFSQLAIVFNIADTGDLDVDLENIYIAIYDRLGNVAFSVAFDEDDSLEPINLALDSGLGTSSFAFVMDAESAAEASALGYNPRYHVGGGIELADGTDLNSPYTVFLVSVAGACIDGCEQQWPPCAATCEPPLPPCEANCSTIPEPGTLTLFGVGLGGLGWITRRRKAAQT